MSFFFLIKNSKNIYIVIERTFFHRIGSDAANEQQICIQEEKKTGHTSEIH